MNFSEEQIQTLQHALQVLFDETATEFVRPKRVSPDNEWSQDSPLRGALLQFLCEDAYAPGPGEILEILSSGEGRQG